ncbi:hypothetical protein HWN40_05140 [Methanolobus zinderi]|uniref:Uncharacterized protein n=1 Tax=Methanolobus zinderi TaxID=536044 RepID=A0A7D5E8F9_9EURY|nr:hypothetical protein [Methanolobus zinderi]QLC49677.1 hypothetical protein HWN40_05140 [Methanolobus zinderi]
MNLDVLRLRKGLLKYYGKYNVQVKNSHSVSSKTTVDECSQFIDEIVGELVAPIENNIRRELSQLFKECENPEIPYFEVVMDIMQFMNDFVGDPHVVELIFVRVNNSVARKKLEVEDKVYYSDEEWTEEVSEAALQRLRDSGTERDYHFMIDQIVDILSYATTEEKLKTVRMRLNNIIKQHSHRELKDLN